jgi:malonyl-CoA/methylmalonyl-CoA synthetase
VDLRTIESSTGHQVRQRYGMTETLIITAARADQPPAPGRVGQPLTGMDVRIDAERHGELGEVQVRGPSLFNGYLNNPDATARAYQGGWFRTGDIGLLHADSGELELFGRQGTDLISSGGYRIGAGEIENALLEHPAVAEAAVLGLPDADLGQRVVAWVVAAEGAPHGGESATADLVDHVVALLGPHKRPREVRYTRELPRNEMGKVVKARLPETITLGDTE